jgi:hypothetical protein
MAEHFLNRPDIGDRTKVAEFTRNPGGETIRVDVIDDMVHVATWVQPRPDGPRVISDNAFVCARSHIPKLMEALLGALTKGLTIVPDRNNLN